MQSFFILLLLSLTHNSLLQAFHTPNNEARSDKTKLVEWNTVYTAKRYKSQREDPDFTHLNFLDSNDDQWSAIVSYYEEQWKNDRLTSKKHIVTIWENQKKELSFSLWLPPKLESIKNNTLPYNCRNIRKGPQIYHKNGYVKLLEKYNTTVRSLPISSFFTEEEALKREFEQCIANIKLYKRLIQDRKIPLSDLSQRLCFKYTMTYNGPEFILDENQQPLLYDTAPNPLRVYEIFLELKAREALDYLEEFLDFFDTQE